MDWAKIRYFIMTAAVKKGHLEGKMAEQSSLNRIKPEIIDSTSNFLHNNEENISILMTLRR